MINVSKMGSRRIATIGIIPEFPTFGGLSLRHRDVVGQMVQSVQPEISEFSFINLYAWRKHYQFSISRLDENLIFLARPSHEPPFFLPPLGDNDPLGTVRKMMAYMRKEGLQPRMSRVPRPLAEMLAASGEFTVKQDRPNWDYVYLASDLINLPGRKYHKKKNHINRFLSVYSYEYHSLTPNLVAGCVELQNIWCNVRDCFSPEHMSLAEEHEAIMDVLSNLEALGTVGGVILIQDKVAAFSLGEPLNNDTFVIHFEKASMDYPGLYQLINRDFCADACSGFTFVNREQDLGEPGLRQAKESYYPHHMVEKFSITGFQD